MENGKLTMKKRERNRRQVESQHRCFHFGAVQWFRMVDFLEIEAPDDQVWSQKNLTVIASFCAKNLLFCSGYEC